MPEVHVRNVFPFLDGVTTAVVLFLFVCLAIPNMIKNRTQYYAALVSVLLIVFLQALAVPLSGTPFMMFAAFFTGILQIVAILMLVMCVGGMDLGQLKGELGSAYEVIRRGETEKEVIIPLTGQKPKSKADDSGGAAPKVVTLDVPADLPPARSAQPPKPQQENSSLPLE